MEKKSGVKWSSREEKWVAYVLKGSFVSYLGYFEDHQQALDCANDGLKVRHRRKVDGGAMFVVCGSGMVGVAWYAPMGCWRAMGRVEGKVTTFGYFDDPRAARVEYEKRMGIWSGVSDPEPFGEDDAYRLSPTGEVYDLDNGAVIPASAARDYVDSAQNRDRLLRVYEITQAKGHSRKSNAALRVAAKEKLGQIAEDNPWVDQMDVTWSSKMKGWTVDGVLVEDQHSAYEIYLLNNLKNGR